MSQCMPSIFGMKEAIPNVGGVEKSLGRDAADVEAGAAQLRVLFNDCCFESVLPGAHGSRVSTGSTPDDDHVISHFSSV